MYFISLTIVVQQLKQLLFLLDSKKKISKLIFGDTGHPMHGFIDETILKGNHSIEALMEMDYNFRGLVIFEMEMGTIKIQWVVDNTYEITGPAHELKEVVDQLMRETQLHPERYNYQFSTYYKHSPK